MMRLNVVWCLLFAVTTVEAQERRLPTTVTVRSLGGFLGLVEGFCEDPGGLYDWASEATPKSVRKQAVAEQLKPCLSSSPQARSIGGALGASELIGQRDRQPGDWLVVTGNNLPVRLNDSFLPTLSNLRPTFVALADDDVLRLVRPSGSAAGVHQWIKDNPSIPYLASNIAVRQTRQSLNHVESGDFALHVPEDQSVSWISTLVLHSHSGVPSMVLEEFKDCSTTPPPGSGTPIPVDPEKKSDGDITLEIPDGLRPGRCYVLTLTTGGRRDQLWFWTDAALTPRPGEFGPLDGFPVIPRLSAGMIGVNLVGSDLRSLLPAKAWKWSEAGADYELLVVDPVKALRQIVRRGTVADHVPAVVLAASMDDEDTLATLDAAPEVRFVVLSPESGLLGRASAERDGDPKAGRPRYSGDLGFSSRVDTGYPEATRVMLRPEWFGETLLEVEATLEAGASGGPMRILPKEPTVTVVPGAELVWTLHGGREVLYEAVLGQTRTKLAVKTQYENCLKPDAESDRCKDFVGLWGSTENATALAARAIRRATNADIGFLSTSILDDDFRNWVQRKIKSTKDASWISKFILERIYYQSPRIVRAFVSGSSLNATLEQIAKADEDGCFVGLGGTCKGPDKEHRERLTINGRRVDARLFYSIALPDRLAEQLDLVHDDPVQAPNVVDAASAYIEKGTWYEPPDEDSAEPLDARVRRKDIGRYRGYLIFPTLSGGVGRVRPSSDQIPSGQIEFAGAKASRSVSVAVDGELAPFDWAHYAIRFPMRLDFAKKRQETSTSYDKDAFSIGGQFDRKFDVPYLGDVRVFVGAFVDGRLHDQHTPLKASTKTSTDPVTVTETVNFTTDFVTEPSHYRHGAVGAEVLGLRKGGTAAWSFEIVRLGARWTRGHETRAPYGAVIDGEPQTIDDFLDSGASGLLGRFFATHRDTFSSTTRFELLTRKQSLARGQADAELSLKRKAWKREFGASYAGQFRWYWYDKDDEPSGLLLRKSQSNEVKFAVPIWRRLALAPAITYQRATLMRQDQKRFSNWIFDVKLSVPFVARWGEGWLFR